jgi:hydroxylamine reductase
MLHSEEPIASQHVNVKLTSLLLSSLCLQTGVSGVSHLHTKDFSAVIARALELPGFTTDNMAQHAAPGNIKRESVTAGFGHHAVLSAADKVINAIQQGNLRHVFVVGEYW